VSYFAGDLTVFSPERLVSSQLGEQLLERMARRAESFGRSPWTVIDQYLHHHDDLIYFGSGAPATERCPVDALRHGAELAWAEIDGSDLDYGELKGYAPLRSLIAGRMRAQGIEVDPGQILITFGSQQGIDIAARLMLNPGDIVACEGPTYIGALQAFDAYEPEYRLFPIDDDGLDVDALIEDAERTGQAPKIIYVIPNYQNPTGRSMSTDRRARLAEFADAHGSLIVEDDPYGEFWYDAPPPPAVRTHSAQVAYVGTFSKTIAPGLRVGWMTVPEGMMGRALMAKESSEVCGVRSVTRVVYQAVRDGFDDHIAEGRAFYRQRREALLSALAGSMPDGVTWSVPGGGFFLWVTLPEGACSTDLLPIAAAHGVGFLPGRFFYPDAAGDDQSFRLSFSSLAGERITEGAARLGTAIDLYLGRRA
jgi:2-aminoadipate transaminase